jgi:multiple sugar transport system substrate-binding protein
VLKTGSGAAVTAAASGALTSLGSRPARAQADSVRVLLVEDPFFFAIKEVLPDFEAETGISVELESLGYDAMQARLVSSFVAGTSDADVITVDQMWSGQYADNGWITPLDQFAQGDSELDINDFIPQVLYSMNLWRGQLVTLPIAAYAQGVMYRTDLFDEFGIAPPPTATDESWTWDAYMEVLNSMTGKQASGGRPLFPTVMCGAQPAPVVHMFTQLSGSLGAKWFKQFPEAPWDFEPLIDSPEWVQALSTYQALYKLSPPEAINYTWFDAGTRYSQGDVGMFYWWTPYFYLIKNNGYMSGTPSEIIDSYAVGALPKVAGRDQTISLGGWSLGLPSSSDKQEAGYRFIKWATSAPKASLKIACNFWPERISLEFSHRLS